MAKIVNNYEEEELQRKLMKKHNFRPAEEKKKNEVALRKDDSQLRVVEWGDDLYQNPLLYKDPFSD